MPKDLMRRLWCGEDTPAETSNDAGSAGGAATVTVEPPSSAPAAVSFDMESAQNPPETKPVSDFEKSIPDDLKEKPYIKELLKSENPNAELFKQFDNLQKKLGERVSAIPGENATEEEIKAFNKAMGVPDTADEYEIPDLVLPEDQKHLEPMMEKLRGSDELKADIKAMFHKNGVPPKMAAALAAEYDGLMLKHNGEAFTAAFEAQKEADIDFSTKAKELYGNRVNAVMEQGKALIEAHADEKAKPYVAGLSNDALMVLSSVLDSVAKKYISEDDIPKPGGGGGMDKEALREQGRQLMNSDAFGDITHPDHEATVRKVNELYKTNFGK